MQVSDALVRSTHVAVLSLAQHLVGNGQSALRLVLADVENGHRVANAAFGIHGGARTAEY